MIQMKTSHCGRMQIKINPIVNSSGTASCCILSARSLRDFVSKLKGVFAQEVYLVQVTKDLDNAKTKLYQ